MQPPNNLSDTTRELWNDIERLASRKLNQADYLLIEAFCHEVETYRKAAKEIADEGFRNQHDQVSAAVTVRNQAATNVRQLYKMITEFLDPDKDIQNPNMRSIKEF